MALTIIDLEQKMVALIAFFTTHMSQIEQVKNDIADVVKQIAELKMQQTTNGK